MNKDLKLEEKIAKLRHDVSFILKLLKNKNNEKIKEINKSLCQDDKDVLEREAYKKECEELRIQHHLNIKPFLVDKIKTGGIYQMASQKCILITSCDHKREEYEGIEIDPDKCFIYAKGDVVFPQDGHTADRKEQLTRRNISLESFILASLEGGYDE